MRERERKKRTINRLAVFNHRKCLDCYSFRARKKTSWRFIYLMIQNGSSPHPIAQKQAPELRKSIFLTPKCYLHISPISYQRSPDLICNSDFRSVYSPRRIKIKSKTSRRTRRIDTIHLNWIVITNLYDVFFCSHVVVVWKSKRFMNTEKKALELCRDKNDLINKLIRPKHVDAKSQHALRTARNPSNHCIWSAVKSADQFHIVKA